MWVKEDANGSTQPLVVLYRNDESLKSISEETLCYTLRSTAYEMKAAIIHRFCACFRDVAGGTFQPLLLH